MLPQNVLSSELILGTYVDPDSRPPNPLVAWEMGGSSYGNSEDGLLIKVWKCSIVNGWATVAPEDGSSAGVPVVEVPNAKKLSFSFDRNMRAVITWESGTTTYLYWYDSASQGFVTTSYPGARSPHAYHDDKRPEASQWSDVLFFYINGPMLCVRNQRERYLIEHQLGPAEPEQVIMNVGFTEKLRIQITLG